MLIEGLQNTIWTAANGLVKTNIVNKVCGHLWNAMADNMGVALATTCTFKTPFTVGVHFDSTDSLADATDKAMTNNYNTIENAYDTDGVVGEGIGYSGFWLAYWQRTC